MVNLKLLMRKISILLFTIAIGNTFLFDGYAKADADGNTVQIGTEYVGDYTLFSPVPRDIDVASTAARGVYEQVIQGNTNWSNKYIWNDSNVWEKDFRSSSKGGNDYRLADDVDLLVYCGHGVVPGSHGASDYSLIMNNKNDTYYAKQGDMSLGDRDLEWFITFTCNFTNGSMDQIGRLAKGVHQICGYRTDMTVTSNAGERFGYWAGRQKITVSGAYFTYAWETQNAVDKNIVGIFRAKNNRSDYLWGNGTTYSDPPAYSTTTKGSYELISQNIF
jgi:hypothetical protein